MNYPETWEEIEEHYPHLTDAEKELERACLIGEECIVGDGLLPEDEDLGGARSLRAPILRYFLLGGCPKRKVRGAGVFVRGAIIEGYLDLRNRDVFGTTQFANCRFRYEFLAKETRFGSLDLSGCVLKGVNAGSATFTGNVILGGVTSSRGVSFSGARVDGQFSAVGAQLASAGGTALNLQSATIAGGVFLHPSSTGDQVIVEKPFSASGTVTMAGATVHGVYAETVSFQVGSSKYALNLANATIVGPVRIGASSTIGEAKFEGANILGDLNCSKAKFDNADGHAFNGQRMQVGKAFTWKKVELGKGAVSLNGAHVGELDDDPSNWPGADRLMLDGFTYDRIKGKVSISEARSEWLNAGSHYDHEFRPQPFSQYAKFLSAAGHDEESRTVLAERERLRRKSALSFLWRDRGLMALSVILWSWFWDLSLRSVVGYGFRPFRSLVWLSCFWLTAVTLGHMSWEAGDFAPGPGVLLVSPEWRAAAEASGNPAKLWSSGVMEGNSYVPGQDWETFNRYAYAADLVIPIINLGQTESWSPSTERGPWGRWLWSVGFLLQIGGWIVTALGAAAITGIIRRD